MLRTRHVGVVAFVMLWTALAFALEETATRKQDAQLKTHSVRRRMITLYSKQPGEESEKETGRKLGHHLKNLLRGGSVGLDLDFSPVKNFFRSVADFFRGGRKKSLRHPEGRDADGGGLLDPRKRPGSHGEMELEDAP